MPVRFPNEAQAYGYWKAHPTTCKRPYYENGVWLVPDGVEVITDSTPLKGHKPHRPNGPPIKGPQIPNREGGYERG